MKRSIYLFLLLFSFYYNLNFAQNDHSTIKTKEIIDQKLNDIAQNFNSDSKQKEKILLQLKAESEKMNYDWGILQSGDYLMQIYLEQNRNKEVVDLGNKLKKIAQNKKDSYGFISSIYRRNALALGYLGLDDASLRDFRTAVRYAENIEDYNRKSFLLSTCYQNITVCFNNKRFKNEKYRDSVLYYLNKSIETVKQIKDNNKYISNDLKYGQIAFVSMRLGIFYLEQPQVKGSLESAEKYLFEGLNIYENEEYSTSPYDMVMMLNQISWLYTEKKDYQTAIKYADRALQLEQQYKDPYHRVESFEFLATSYLEIGEKEKSKFYMGKYSFLKDSLAYAEKNNADMTMKEMATEADNLYRMNSRRQFILTGVLIIIIIATTFILWNRRSKIVHKKYEELIHKIKSEKIESLIPEKTKSVTENKEPKSKIVIADETTKSLLSKLEKFEKSKLYLQKDIGVVWLANHVNTNTKYLSDLIRNHREKNFTDYINGLRINYLLHKLVNDPLYRQYKIIYLAEECGFASRQVFLNAFKKETGFTPSYFIGNLKKDKKTPDTLQ